MLVGLRRSKLGLIELFCVYVLDVVTMYAHLSDSWTQMSFSDAQLNFTITVRGIRACQKSSSFPDQNFRAFSDTEFM